MQRRHLLFIDDDPHEVETFKRLYKGGQFHVTAIDARDPHEAARKVRKALNGSVPSLFVLDLYFPLSKSAPTGFDEPRTHKKVANGLRDIDQALGDLRASLKDSPADGKLLLQGAWSVVQRSRELLDDWCKRLGQSPRGGIDLLQALHKMYPRVPAVFYSRKASLADAKAALAAGALDIVPKPDAAVEVKRSAEIAEAFVQYAQCKPPRFIVRYLKRFGARIGIGKDGPTGEVWAEWELPTSR
jgi:CheY-like chemotaxis protein